MSTCGLSEGESVEKASQRMGCCGMGFRDKQGFLGQDGERKMNILNRRKTVFVLLYQHRSKGLQCLTQSRCLQIFVM